MICEIDTGYSSARMCAAIDYHERKVEEGVAKRDEINMAASNGEQIKARLEDHVSAFNPRVHTQKFHQVSFNFAPTDELSEGKKREIVHEWMEHMGYDKHLYVLYHHMDKSHDHWHLITPCSDEMGLRMATKNNFYKSSKFTRLLEQKHGMRILAIQSEEKTKSLKEGAAEKYAVYNALQKLSDTEKTLPCFDLLFGLQVAKGQFSYDQAHYAYKKAGRVGDLGIALKHLRDQGLLKKPEKGELYELLLEARNTSRSLLEFNNLLDTQQIYHREVFYKGKKTIMYGLKGKYYFRDYQISKEFTPERLAIYYKSPEKYKVVGKAMTPGEVKDYLKRSIYRAALYSLNLEQFKAFLADRSVEVKFSSNSSGIYGYSVLFQGTEIKASSIDKELSYTKIKQILSNNAFAPMPSPSRFAKRSSAPAEIKAPATASSIGKIANVLDRAAAEAEAKRKARQQQQDEADNTLGL